MAGRNQPTYDFLTGASSPPPPTFRETLRQSQLHKPDTGNEDIRAQLHTLQYELDSLKQEKEVTNLRYQRELREAQKKADDEYSCRAKAESRSNEISAKYDSLSKELQDLQDQSANEKAALERKVRAAQDKNQALQEELDEAQTEISSLERQSKHRYAELETRHNSLQNSCEELQMDLEAKVSALKSAQQRVSEQEETVGQLESEILKLKSQSGDSDALAVLKRELSEQVAHIRKLEITNRDQTAELKQFRKTHKSIEVVEEEKRVLENKLRLMDDLRRELGESELKRQVLENERKSWSAYLESVASTEGELQFDSPEDMARAFVRERLEVASLMEKLGAIQPELRVKEDIIKGLEDEKSKLQVELEKLRTSGGANTTTDNKAKTRLERQRTLAVKEVEYLRAQLKNFELEESELQPEQFDKEKSARIQELEDMIDEYRKEIQNLHKDLSNAEELARQNSESTPAAAAGSKRRRESEEDERLGELRRKNRQAQEDISKLQSRNAFLETSMKALESQVSSLRASSRIRVLELKSNPTADSEALKLSTVKTLREENALLMSRLKEKSHGELDSVPVASLAAARDEIAELKQTVAEREKRMLRLKQIWSAKSLEFREAVASILGWKLDFMPNGRVRVTSMFYPGDEETGENSIVFDGENGTMKVSGGPQSVFAGEIRELILEWVEQRKEIPCFLAAMTLDFWDRRQRATE